MRRSPVSIAAFVLLAACDPRASEPTVTQAWVRLPAVPGQPAAAYFTLRGGTADDRLVKIESAMARRTEVHASMTGMHGMTTMTPLASLNVARGATTRFSPGGYHAMLFGLDRVVTPGTAVPLRFGFASGKTTEAEAKTVAAGGDAPY